MIDYGDENFGGLIKKDDKKRTVSIGIYCCRCFEEWWMGSDVTEQQIASMTASHKCQNKKIPELRILKNTN